MLKANDLESLYDFLQGRDLNVAFGPFHFMRLRIKLSEWQDGSYTLQSEYNEHCDFQLNSDDILNFEIKTTCIGSELIIKAMVKYTDISYKIKIW
jgi:hypothetical protein